MSRQEQMRSDSMLAAKVSKQDGGRQRVFEESLPQEHEGRGQVRFQVGSAALVALSRHCSAVWGVWHDEVLESAAGAATRGPATTHKRSYLTRLARTRRRPPLSSSWRARPMLTITGLDLLFGRLHQLSPDSQDPGAPGGPQCSTDCRPCRRWPSYAGRAAREARPSHGVRDVSDPATCEH
jgi:hypothetical protein